ncbi:hypothetical protein SAMN05518672_11019 [Chitinophaga sp. CF118]|nr:hypothetical protein [Chitinophaga sp. CF118]SFE76751.1 hypothetical protein SAMN05518672_11019 [Chitinophaga sp. CF118]
MKKKSEKKLHLGKIKVASLSKSKNNMNAELPTITVLCLSLGDPNNCRF